MSKVKVDSTKCPQDHSCPLVRVCPAGAISQSGYGAPVVDSEKCISCGRCVITCPYHCLAFE
ncbi:MAG: 4Fe-4S binding protein [Candidatus Moraniibacteriota bacterium]